MVDHGQLQARFDDIVAFCALERFIDQKLKNFSSGMQVRLAYSIAIQVDFDILLLDEVLAVGDASFQRKCFGTFARFREEGKTIVLVTHSLHLIERFADRALLRSTDASVRSAHRATSSPGTTRSWRCQRRPPT